MRDSHEEIVSDHFCGNMTTHNYTLVIYYNIGRPLTCVTFTDNSWETNQWSRPPSTINKYSVPILYHSEIIVTLNLIINRYKLNVIKYTHLMIIAL